MSRPVLARAAPLRFLIGVVLCWTLGRVVALADWSSGPVVVPSRYQPLVTKIARPPAILPRGEVATAELRLSAKQARTRSVAPRAAASAPMEPDAAPFGHAFARPEAEQAMPDAEAVATPRAPTRSRWSGSAWAFVRGGGRTGTLAPVGQIGGGQAGMRILYRLDEDGRVFASGRLSRTIGGLRQGEAAVGLDWKPIDRLPVHVMAERRIAIDKGGRDAWTLGVAGGVYAVPIATHWRFDGYGEAGVVGTQRRDLYADGAVRIGRPIDFGSGVTLAPGAGLWGAAQPGAERLDIGPSIVLRLPVAKRNVAVALDWRERVAGDAKPGSGVALTVGVDF